VAPASRLLVVDDDGVSRHLLGQMLNDAGLSADVVESGAEAVRYLGNHPAPAAILLDLVMPEPDGYAILRYVRAEPRLAAVPVVVLTALDSDGEIERAFASGADDYVQKPSGRASSWLGSGSNCVSATTWTGWRVASAIRRRCSS
jgi:CheY-like chemotaxis protein